MFAHSIQENASEQIADEDLETNEDQNHAADNAGAAGQLSAGLLADLKAAHANDEGHRGDDE